MSRESFVFYSSFAQAANMLGDKARLKLYDAVVKLGLCCAKDVTELEQVCAEIESNLVQNRNAFAQFLLIKPQIIANFTRYINGSKGRKYGELGAEYGKLGGRPRKNDKNPPNENVNVNVNDNDNNIYSDKSPNLDYPFVGKVIKLNQKDYDNWQSTFPELNLKAELLVRDNFLAGLEEKERKNWFMSTFQYFIKQNERRKKQNKETGTVSDDDCWF